MTRSIPNHGTASRYRGDARNNRWAPCRCEPCRTARRRQRKAVELHIVRGRGSRHPLEPVIAHIELLMRSGWTLNAIEKASGVDRRGMFNIRNRRQKTVHHATAARLFKLQPGATPHLVDATGARRRIQALVVMGWSMSKQAEEAGLSHTAIEEIASGLRRHVVFSTHEAIRALYRQRSRTRGPSGWARSFGARQGWHGPMDWDDIDDVSANPELAEPYKAIAKGGRDTLRRQEIRHLLDCGESVASIARQMDVNEKYISDLISQGLPDSYQTAA